MKFQTSLQTSSRFSDVIMATDVAIGCLGATRLYGQNGLYQIQLVLAELVANSVEHGNKFDLSKSVEIKMETVNDDTTISVIDDGPGIDPAVLDKLHNPESLRGHGLHMVKQITGNLGVKDGHIFTILIQNKHKE